MKGGAEKPLQGPRGHYLGALRSPQPRPSIWEKGRTALLRPHGHDSSLLGKHHKVYLLQLIKVQGRGSLEGLGSGTL